MLLELELEVKRKRLLEIFSGVVDALVWLNGLVIVLVVSRSQNLVPMNTE